MNMLSHTPPGLPVGSLEPPIMKRARSGSISNRLRSASELCEEGMIDKEAKGALKDMIIRDDPKLQHAMKRIEEGDKQVLKEMLADGTLNRKASIDLMGEYGDLNFDFLNVGGVDSPGNSPKDSFMEEPFEFSLTDNTLDPPISSNTTSASRPIKNNARSPRYRNMQNHDDDDTNSNDIKPIPIKKSNNTIPDLFEFNLFDDTMGDISTSHGSNGNNSHQPRLHRDSIALMDDLLGTGDGEHSSSLGRFSSFEGSPMMKYNQNPSQPPKQQKPPKLVTSSTTMRTRQKTKSSSSNTRTSNNNNANTRKNQNRSSIKKEQTTTKQIQTRHSQPIKIVETTTATTTPPPVTMAFEDLGPSNPTGYVGGYSPDSRRRRIEKFLLKRQNRVWMKRVKYDVRKNFADSRLRVKGRFVKKEDEELLREFIVMTL